MAQAMSFAGDVIAQRTISRTLVHSKALEGNIISEAGGSHEQAR